MTVRLSFCLFVCAVPTLLCQVSFCFTLTFNTPSSFYICWVAKKWNKYCTYKLNDVSIIDRVACRNVNVGINQLTFSIVPGRLHAMLDYIDNWKMIKIFMIYRDGTRSQKNAKSNFWSKYPRSTIFISF